ncbi:MAG TPA: co-chaperone GroES [Acholeplasmataceae bacterium]|nr:co-chaperone GroES [Acholeplasmataceae bacterium]
MLKPLSDHVILSYIKEEEKTASGIILTTEAKEKQSMGKVVAIGPKVEDIKVDDKVVYQSYSGTKTKFNDEEYLIIKAEDILAIYED